MSWRGLARSAGVRLALGYALLFSVSTMALVFVLWTATLGLLNAQVDAAIEADAQGLAERWQDGGARALLSTIEERLAGNVDDSAIYLLLDPAGQPVIGNLRDWPSQVTGTSLTYELRVRRAGRESLARLHRFALPGGYTLLVGRDVQSRAALRTLLARTLGSTLLGILALGLGGAIVVQRLFQRMLSHVSATAAAISGGDLSRRVRLSGRGDEFDRLAETINDMLDRISRLMDGVREVSNAIAHDLRTPITRARARLEDAVAHAPDAETLRAEAQQAIADLDAITAVFQALLRISEIEAGARRSAFTRLDLAPLLRDLADLYEAVAEERGLTLVTDLDPSLPTQGDRALIQQAITNLLDNALKFSPPGGTVILRGRRSGNSLRLSVSDEGPGIPPGDVERATERFFRGEAARNTPGFGLGLTLVRAVAQLHGGTLALGQSRPGEAAPGLQATLIMPAAEERPLLPPERQHQHVTVG